MLLNHLFAQTSVLIGFLSLYASALPVGEFEAQSALIKADGVADTFWLANIPKRGKATFNSDSGYQVFRNVRDFGAVGMNIPSIRNVTIQVLMLEPIFDR